MPFDSSDLSAFIDPDMPGYRLGTLWWGGTVAGLFSDGYSEAFGGQVGGSKPTLRCISADVSDVEVGDTITIGGVDYTVGQIQPAGRVAGMSLVFLEKS